MSTNIIVELPEKMSLNSGGSKGGVRDACPPWGPKFFQFHAVFGKIWRNRMLVPPGCILNGSVRGRVSSSNLYSEVSKTKILLFSYWFFMQIRWTAFTA